MFLMLNYFSKNNLQGDGPVLHQIHTYPTDQHQFVQCGNHIPISLHFCQDPLKVLY